MESFSFQNPTHIELGKGTVGCLRARGTRHGRAVADLEVDRSAFLPALGVGA